MKIALDIGNVLVAVNTQALGELLKEFGCIKDMEETVSWVECLGGLVNLGVCGFYDALRTHLVVGEAEAGRLTQAWHEMVEMPPEIRQVLEDASQIHKMILASNIGPEHASVVRGDSLFNSFPQFFSYEVGAAKPSRLFFHQLRAEHPGFRGATFIDDREENLAAAAGAGMKTIQFRLDEHPTYAKAAEVLGGFLGIPKR